MATDAVTICNRALQLLGAARITSLTQDSKNARACNVAYDSRRLAMLAGHPWMFAIARMQLAEDSVAPVFGRAHSFAVPSDFLRLLPPYPEDDINSLDWIIEGQSIYTDDVAPLNIRYIKDISDPTLFNPLFAEALSADLADNLCEEITQSNQKKDVAIKAKKDAINEAKRINAIQQVVAAVPDDTYLTCRN